MIKKIKSKGFSLIEVVVVTAIMMILISMAILLGRSFNNTENLENSGKIIQEKIKVTKARSLGAVNNTNYGIHFETGRIVIFPGSTFVDGAATNEIFNLPSNINIYNISLYGGGSDLVFNRLTGTTANFGSIGVRVANDTAKTKQIFINAEGQSSFGAFRSSAGAPVVNAKHVHFNLGWNIQNETAMRLEWVNSFNVPIIINDVSMAAYFNADKSQFDWEGATTVNSVIQNIRVHSWLDGSSNTVLCVMRYETENEKLNIYFNGNTKEIATYENVSGEVVVNANSEGGTMEIQ